MDSLSFAYLWQTMLEHLCLSAAIVIAVPLAVWLAEKRRPAELVLQDTGVLQTIPSLALLGLLIPLVGIDRNDMALTFTGALLLGLGAVGLAQFAAAPTRQKPRIGDALHRPA